jgi:hypothetical protein
LFCSFGAACLVAAFAYADLRTRYPNACRCCCADGRLVGGCLLGGFVDGMERLQAQKELNRCTTTNYDRSVPLLSTCRRPLAGDLTILAVSSPFLCPCEVSITSLLVQACTTRPANLMITSSKAKSKPSSTSICATLGIIHGTILETTIQTRRCSQIGRDPACSFKSRVLMPRIMNSDTAKTSIIGKVIRTRCDAQQSLNVPSVTSGKVWTCTITSSTG